MQDRKWTRSRFNAISKTEDGGLLLYNSYTGGITAFSPEEREEVMEALQGNQDGSTLTELQQKLVDMSYLVPADADESRRAKLLFQQVNRADFLHLAILPTEECNFRCTYCYEDYARGKMSDETINGIKKYVLSKAPTLQHLAVTWFGGEPLAAADVVEELSSFFSETCAVHNVQYTAEVLTNGYYLSGELHEKLVSWNTKQYMITIDGPEAIHDVRRALQDGGGTYQVIMDNLKQMKQTNLDFEVALRVNFDNDNLPVMDELIDIFAQNFAHDRRFQIYFRPVGCMGGKNDAHLPICDLQIKDQKIWELTQKAIDRGLTMSSLIENSLMPLGSTCYCVKPHSFVVGSDGSLYKCSVAFNDPINQVGKLTPDGTMEIDIDKFAHWVSSDELDETCSNCFFRPACNGNHCKLFRMKNNDRPCSFEKRKIGKVLQTIHKQYTQNT
ncbi:radical SAM protein [Brevibacillus ginsengisoli]|uniref:radical SAM protein n=1 Tax=Brevibacillus ginsengisoli TaxID=363854 RepID=UPI003CF5AAAE